MCSLGSGFWHPSFLSSQAGFASDVAVRAVQPVINSIPAGTQFDGTTLLYVNGRGFLRNSPVVTFDSVAQTTTVVSDSQCTIAMAASGTTGTVFEVPASHTVSVATSQGTTTNYAWDVSRFAAEEVWLRADLGITNVSGKASAWLNQSGIVDTNRDQVQATAGLRPTITAVDAAYNNQQTLLWPATNGYMAGATDWTIAITGEPLTVYTVGHAPVSGADKYMVTTNVTPTYAVLARSTEVWRMFRGVGLNSATASTAKAAVCSVFSTTAAALYVNAPTTAEASSTMVSSSWFQLTVGGRGTGSNFNNGTIAEILIFSAAHTAAQRATIMGYLGRRYSITIGA